MINSSLFDVQLSFFSARGERWQLRGWRHHLRGDRVRGTRFGDGARAGPYSFEAITSNCREGAVDMTQVEFIDAAGVGTLLTGARGAAAAGAHLHLRAASPAVERVLRLVGFDEAIEAAGGPVGRSGES